MTTIFYELMDPDVVVGASHPAITLIDGATNTVYQQVYFPATMTVLTSVKVFVVPGASGNMRVGAVTNWGRVCVDAYNSGADTYPTDDIPVTVNEIECIDITAAFTGVLAGSLAGIAFTRYGNHANDTIGANCYYLGAEVSYT